MLQTLYELFGGVSALLDNAVFSTPRVKAFQFQPQETCMSQGGIEVEAWSEMKTSHTELCILCICGNRRAHRASGAIPGRGRVGLSCGSICVRSATPSDRHCDLGPSGLTDVGAWGGGHGPTALSSEGPLTPRHSDPKGPTGSQTYSMAFRQSQCWMARATPRGLS